MDLYSCSNKEDDKKKVDRFLKTQSGVCGIERKKGRNCLFMNTRWIQIFVKRMVVFLEG